MKTNKQYSLFEEDNKENSPKNNDENVQVYGIQISEKDSKKESKLKKLVSSRLKKIEKLKQLLEKDKDFLLLMKSIYHKKSSTPLKKHNEVVFQYLKALLQRYSQKSFSYRQKDILEELIEEHINILNMNGYQNEEFTEFVDAFEDIAQKLEKEQFGDEEDYDAFFDDEASEEFEHIFGEHPNDFAKNMVKEMLENMGLEVDEAFFDGLDPKDADFSEKFQERLHEYHQRQEDNFKKEKKKKKIDSLKSDKDFAKLYKKLVKKVHPDLTTDVVEKARREELMKELSTVWDNRDYYQLLVIQSKIEEEPSNNLDLNENHLYDIAQDLLDKIRHLEAERYQFKRHPQNGFFFDNFFGKTERNINLNVEHYLRKLEKETKEIVVRTKRLKNQKTTKEFLKEVSEEMEDDFYIDFW